MPATGSHAGSKFFALFRSHLLPATAHVAAASHVRPHPSSLATEQNPAQAQQSDRLPVGDLVKSE